MRAITDYICWICRIEDVRGGGDVGSDGHDAIGWAAEHTASLSKGVNEGRGKQRIVRTIMPAFQLLEERKKGEKEGVVGDGSVPPSHLMMVVVLTHPRDLMGNAVRGQGFQSFFQKWNWLSTN